MHSQAMTHDPAADSDLSQAADLTPDTMPASDVTWIVVANECRARIYEQNGKSGAIRSVFQHTLYGDCSAEAAQPSGAMMRDHRSGARHRAFATSLARILDSGLGEGRYDSLVLVAPPQTLGSIKGCLPSTVRSRLASEVGQNLTNVASFELPNYLGRLLHR